MSRDEIRARFRTVVTRALAKPLDELPYRPPVKTRFHYADTGRQDAPDRAKDGYDPVEPTR